MENLSKICEEYDNLKRNLYILQNDCKNDINEVISNIINNVKFLRNSCAIGPNVQEYILSLPEFFNVISPLLNNKFPINNSDSGAHCNAIDNDDETVCRMSWQLIANLCVQNNNTQIIIWDNVGYLLIEKLENEISSITNIQLMILYNIFYNGNLKIPDSTLFKLILNIWNKIYNKLPDFINNLDYFHIIMEFFITRYPRIITLYGPLNDVSERILFLKYISQYIKNDHNKMNSINESLLNYISKEFKKKSDCILRTTTGSLSSLPSLTFDPMEIFILLEIIASTSGNELYENLYKNDHSLFLNVGSLLQQLNEIGKKSQNIFTPMQKLEEVAPNCKLPSTNFENEISYEFKTMLVRTLANLLYKNTINQNYCRETGILMAICDCTTVDARNPLIKEWSILAIRNLCENCPENQEFMKNLYKVGDVSNDVLKELDLEFGLLRIQSN